MKLSKLKPQTQELPVYLPNGEDTGIRLKVVSKDNARVRELQRELFVLSEKELDPAAKHRAVEQQAYKMAAACVVDWSGIEDEEGNPLQFSKEQCEALFHDPELMYLTETVMEFAGKRQHFF